jgi:ubiquinone/menaquinone biosynthesis C-methylase UbiE
VLLIRGDAQRLPIASGVLGRLNCSGGFLQIPDLPRALAELARVGRPGARLTASTFAEAERERLAPLKRLSRRFGLHFVPLDWLERELAAAGFGGFSASLAGGLFAYTSAERR